VDGGEAIWQLIGTAPRDGTRILAWSSGSETFHVLEFDNAAPAGWMSDSGDYVVFEDGDLTHWTALPTPPSDVTSSGTGKSRGRISPGCVALFCGGIAAATALGAWIENLLDLFP
jgi:hypothetical protein